MTTNAVRQNVGELQPATGNARRTDKTAQASDPIFCANTRGRARVMGFGRGRP